VKIHSLRPLFGLAIIFASACGGDSSLKTDAGARHDIGAHISSLDGGMVQPDTGVRADAQIREDATPNADTGPAKDAGFELDAAAGDTGLNLDASPMDAGFVDSGPQPPSDGGFADVGHPDTGTLVGPQTGELIMTEVMAHTNDLEWIELKNVSGQDQDLGQFILEFGSRPGVSVSFYAGTNPTGTSTSPFILAANLVAYFVLNPVNANEIPADAHVYGFPGQFGGDGFQNGGDTITLKRSGMVVDALEMTDIATENDSQITATQFPIILNHSVQLSRHLTGALGVSANDFAAAWCAPIWRGPTPGRANHDCNWFVISEVLYDYDSVSTGSDNGFEFVEIAGPAGAYMQDLQVSAIQGSASNAGAVIDSDLITTLRMPGNGLYLVADQSSAGQTSVINADQIVDLQLQNGPDAIQLLRVSASSGVTYFDSFGYGALTPNLTDTARMQPAYEGTPVADLAPRIRPVNWARSQNQQDTQNNATDFHHDPSPTPGTPNIASVLELNSITPNNALASDTATISFVGHDFTDFMRFDFNGLGIDPADCSDVGANEVECTVSFSSTVSAAPVRYDANAQSRVEHGQAASLPGGFTWSISQNETDNPLEVDFCNIQHPPTLTVSATAASDLIFGRIYEAGMTDVTSGESTLIVAQVGYGPTHADPSISNAWRWHAAAFNVEYGNDDEYQAILMVDTPGTYHYAYRFSIDDGLSWTVCDLDGAGSNPSVDFSNTQLGVLTVTP
jgi:hypothetical protein